MQKWIIGLLNRYRNSNNAMVKMSFSLCAVSIIVIIMLCVVYSNSTEMIIEKQVDINKDVMKLRIQKIDNIFQKLDIDLFNLSNELSKYENAETLSIEEKFDLLNMKNVVLSQETKNASVYIYLKKMNIIIDLGKTVNSLNTFYDTSWLKDYENAGFLGYNAMHIYERTNHDGEEVMSILREFPLETKEKQGVLILNINRNELFEDFYDFEQLNKPYFVCDDDGNLIFGNKLEFDKYSAFLDFNIENERTEKIKNIFIQVVKSEYNGWHYIDIRPYSEMIAELNSLKIMLIFMIFVTFCLMVFFGAQLQKKIYKPIAKLIEKVDVGGDTQTTLYGKYNEFEYLERAIELLVENRDDTGKFNSKVPARNILTTICANEEVNEQDLLMYEMNPNKWFVVTAIKFEEYENIIDKVAAKECLLKNLDLVNSSEVHTLSGCISENVVLSLFCIAEKKTDKMPYDFLKDIKKYMEENYNTTISVGIGNAYVGIKNLYKSYTEALNALRLIAFTNRGSIIDVQNEPLSHTKLNYKEMITIEMDYIKCLKAADAEAAKECLEKIFCILPRNLYVADNLSGLVWHFMNDIFSIMKEMNIEPLNAIHQTYEECYEEFLIKEHLSELRELLFYKVECFAEYISKDREQQNENLIDTVRNYINENIDKDITLDDIAEKVHLSPKYVNLLFKKRFNTTIFAYINRLKMERAEYYLSETSNNVEQISNKLGYANFRSFTRAFKNYHGVTPSQYRALSGRTNISIDNQDI